MARLRPAEPEAEATEQEVEVISISSDDEPQHSNARSQSKAIARDTALRQSSANSTRHTQSVPKRPRLGKGGGWTGWEETEVKMTRSGKENVDPGEVSGRPSAAQDDLERQVRQEELSTRILKERPLHLSYWVRGEQGRYWSHNTYRGPNNAKVKITYCCTRAESEAAAQMFLIEPVVGFDMEWKSRGGKGIKGNISLIQIACEDKIALFHIALHSGSSVSELVAPSLRKIIESPSVSKSGVAIMNADGQRLRRCMRLDPKGLFELSFLHRIVKYGHRKPELVSKKLVKLTYLAHDHLGRPLHKGPVRTSDWTKPLTQQQIDYAASDAYAGFRLYHAMETKRLKMSPVPPRPAHAELKLPLRMTDDDDEPDKILAEPIMAVSSNADGASSTSSRLLPRDAPWAGPVLGGAVDSMQNTGLVANPTSKRALSALRALRKRVSLKTHVPEVLLVADATLVQLATMRSRSHEDLAKTPACQAWTALLVTHGIDLAGFLSKHAPIIAGAGGEPVAAELAAPVVSVHSMSGSFEDRNPAREETSSEDIGRDDDSGESDDEEVFQSADVQTFVRAPR